MTYGGHSQHSIDSLMFSIRRQRKTIQRPLRYLSLNDTLIKDHHNLELLQLPLGKN